MNLFNLPNMWILIAGMDDDDFFLCNEKYNDIIKEGDLMFGNKSLGGNEKLYSKITRVVPPIELIGPRALVYVKLISKFEFEVLKKIGEEDGCKCYTM